MVKPKKHLGQHFLTDPAIALRITDILEDNSPGTVIEVGPGKGILSNELIRRFSGNLVLIELDEESVHFLNQKYEGEKVRILHGDFLNHSLADYPAPIRVIGNFPYNISSQIFFHILEYRDQVDQITGMLQKEVAARIASPPGSKQYGILSVLLQAWYDIRICFHVRPGSFFPPPRVDSSVIELKRNQRMTLGCSEKVFLRLVKSTFNQRRKQLGNSLKRFFLNLPGKDFDLSLRPEQLSVEDFIRLCVLLEKINPEN